jgi:hypothetical protein
VILTKVSISAADLLVAPVPSRRPNDNDYISVMWSPRAGPKLITFIRSGNEAVPFLFTSFNNLPGADLPHVRLAVRHAQVRSFINSGLRTNDALFGCASGCGCADKRALPDGWYSHLASPTMETSCSAVKVFIVSDRSYLICSKCS